MKLSVSDIFVNLNKAATDAVKKTNSSLDISNSAFTKDGVFANKSGDYQFNVSSEKELKKDVVKKAIVTYFTVFSGKDSVKNLNDKDIIQNDNVFSISYHIEMLKNLKESKIITMKNIDEGIGDKIKAGVDKVKKAITEKSAPKPTFEISPNELVGKLHQAAMDQVEKKYGNVISLFNTAIDTNQDPPMASLQQGMFKIKLKLVKPSGDKKKDKQVTKDALKEYLTWFAGKDVAKTADKPKFFIFKSKLDKAKEKNADGSQGYTVYFNMTVEKVDPKKNEKKADDEAAKESIVYKFDGCQTAIVECSKLVNMLNVINESNKMKEKYILKESEEVTEKTEKTDTSTKESGFTINPSELIGKLHEAAMQAMVKKYGNKCTIINTAIDEDHKPPLCTTKPGQYKIVVKQLKKGLFGSTKAAREAIRLYLTVFAGEDVAKDILKAKFFIFGKSKLEKGKHEGQAGNAAGFSVYYQLDKGETTESMKIQLHGAAKHVVECNELYKKTLPIVEHMPTKTEAMVSAILNDNNVRASELLEDIVSSKVKERLTAVLSK